jgi:hypothetical protein
MTIVRDKHREQIEIVGASMLHQYVKKGGLSRKAIVHPKHGLTRACAVLTVQDQKWFCASFVHVVVNQTQQQYVENVN